MVIIGVIGTKAHSRSRVGVALWVEVEMSGARCAMGGVGGTIVRPHLLYMLGAGAGRT